MAELKRRHRRYEVTGVRGSVLHTLDARILNMSLTGMAVETSSMLRTGASYALRVPQGDGTLRFAVEVKWCHLVRTDREPAGGSVPVFQAGLDFRAMLDERAREILGFLEQNVVVEIDRRLCGRFKPSEPLAAEMSRSEPFSVQRLSLSGMLVETELQPRLDQALDLEVDSGRGRVDLRGRVTRVEPARPRSAAPDTSEGPRWSVELELTGLSPEARASLIALIESLLE